MARLNRLTHAALVFGLLLALAALLLGAEPQSGGVDDGAHLFSAGALTQAAQQIRQIELTTNRGIAVVTVPSLNGQNLQTAALDELRRRQLDGVLIYISRDDHALAVEVAADARGAITPPEQTAIRDTMLDQFSQGSFDLGLLDGIQRVGQELQTSPKPSAGFAGTTAEETVFLLAGAIVLAAFLTILANPRAFQTGPAAGRTQRLLQQLRWRRGQAIGAERPAVEPAEELTAREIAEPAESSPAPSEIAPEDEPPASTPPCG